MVLTFTDNIKSQSLVNLDTVPTVPNTTGEGGPGYTRNISDIVFTTAAGATASQSSVYRLCRVPTTAKIKSVKVTTAGVDQNLAAAAVLTFGMVFSDSTEDQTSTSLQSMVPTQGQTGGVISLASLGTTGSNNLFGTLAVKNSGALQTTDITNNATGAGLTGVASSIFGNNWVIGPTGAATGANATGPGSQQNGLPGTQCELWNFFGFQNAQGYPADPGGMMDFYAWLSTAAGTGATGGFIKMEVAYVD